MLTSVRARVVLPIVSVLMLFLTILGYGLFQQLAHETLTALDRTLRFQGDYIAFLLQSKVDPDGMASLEPHLLTHPDLPHTEKLIRILKPTGEVLYQTGPHAFHEIRGLTSFADAITSGGSVFQDVALSGTGSLRLVSMPVKLEHRTAYVVQVAVPRSTVQKANDRIRFLIIWACALLLLGALVGGWIITGLALKPVHALTSSAKNIGIGNLEERLPTSESHDELEELARTFNDMIERLDGSSKQIRRFTADASHELRTPLTIMKGEIEVALRKSRSADEWRQIARSLLEEVNHMSEIVEDLLSLTRIDSGEMTIEKEVVDLNEILYQKIQQYRKVAETNKCVIEIETLPRLFVQGDAEQLGRLFGNLLDNAIKYSVNGGTIRLTARTSAKTVAISVQDHGLGIARDDLPRIFERFYRGRNSRAASRRGTGLGLSICSWVAEAHGGHVEVISQQGRGSTFTVRLPSDLPRETQPVLQEV